MLPGTTQVVTPACINCGQTSTVKGLRVDDVARWLTGVHVQDVWPEMPPPQRELLITGTHPECWEAMFGSPEEIDA
jgi:hypothetical protein